jgi:hypothetical protein
MGSVILNEIGQSHSWEKNHINSILKNHILLLDRKALLNSVNFDLFEPLQSSFSYRIQRLFNRSRSRSRSIADLELEKKHTLSAARDACTTASNIALSNKSQCYSLQTRPCFI